MKKLISMTDFVLDQHQKCISSTNTTYNYAEFLKLPLTLAMFVPCDLDGNYLEEPTDQVLYKMSNWYEAKNRIVFEGFEVDYDTIIRNKDIRLWFTEGKIFLNNTYTELRNIEDLIKYDLELTPTALKRIGIIN